LPDNAWAIDAKDFGNVRAVIRKIKDYGYDGFETGFANVQRQFERAGDAGRRIECELPASLHDVARV
jgi:hypothetical protein